jgi:hypothetical protein
MEQLLMLVLRIIEKTLLTNENQILEFYFVGIDLFFL